ncbi:MAG: MFS transporter [Actinomycetota bacterium]
MTAERSRGLGPREFIAFVALISASSALAIDIMLPAFADMRDQFDLDDDATDLSLTLTLFFVGNGVGNFFAGPLADAIGRRRLLQASMAMYFGAAVLAGLATSLWLLFAARFLWGFAAAGPRVLSQAIVRDRHSGDAMARVMTLVHAAFTIGPIAAPIIGAGLVELGSWRWVMWFGAFIATVVMLWSTRFEESLAPEDRRRFDPATVFRGYSAVMANPVMRGYTIAVTFGFGAFYSFLASTELIFDDVFDRSSWFVPYFSIVSAMFGLTAIGANRFLQRRTGTELITLGGASMVVFSVALLGLALATDGRPAFVVFIFVFALANASHVAVFPTMNSLALEPMGKLAGTAAAVLGVTTSIIAALLGSLIDRAIDGSITPLAIGYTIYSSLAFAAQYRTTRRHQRAALASTG